MGKKIKNKKETEFPYGYRLIILLLLFVVISVVIDFFPKKNIFDYQERELAKGLVIEEKKYKNSRSFIYEFKYKELYYRGEVATSKASCSVGDSCLIRFAVADPSVSIYVNTISKKSILD